MRVNVLAAQFGPEVCTARSLEKRGSRESRVPEHPQPWLGMMSHPQGLASAMDAGKNMQTLRCTATKPILGTDETIPKQQEVIV